MDKSNDKKKKHIILESVHALLENSAINFGGESFPKMGWAVWTAGGPGSGKSTVINNQMLIDAKVFDSDKIKEMYVKLLKRRLDEENLSQEEKDALLEPFGGRIPDFKNPKDTDLLHRYVSWKKHFFSKHLKDFIKTKLLDKNFLSNLIIDTTGNDLDDIQLSALKLKQLGYKTALVWVVANIALAKRRNQRRERVVDEEYLTKVHLKLIKKMPLYLQCGNFSALDEVWIVFSKDSLNNGNVSFREKFNNTAFKLEKLGDSFIIPSNLMNEIIAFTGIRDKLTRKATKYVRQRRQIDEK